MFRLRDELIDFCKIRYSRPYNKRPENIISVISEVLAAVTLTGIRSAPSGSLLDAAQAVP
jgi:hypothetical protein